jgi:hypothetical protein
MMDHLLLTSDLGRSLETENFLYLYLTVGMLRPLPALINRTGRKGSAGCV